MTTTNFPNGATNADSNSAMGTLTQLDPTKLHTYLNDFNLYKAADWVVTVTELGSGSATQAIADEADGILEITNDDADDDSSFLQLANETFQFVSGKKLHFKALFTVSGGTASAFNNGSFFIGLQIRDTTPLDVSDGVYFTKIGESDATDLLFHVVKDSVISSASVATTVFDDTNEVAFIYDGKSEVQYWFNDVKIGSLDTTNLPDDEELTISFGIENGNTTARTMHIDYIYVANER